MSRSQFTFYESFACALRRIRKKQDRAEAYDAIVNYALYGTEPDLESLPDSAAIAFELIRPNLDASKRKAESGKRGGEHKQTASKPQANHKQEKLESKPEAISKQGEIQSENEIEIENECYPPTPLQGKKKAKLVPPTLEEVEAYRKQRGSAVSSRDFFDYFEAGNWVDSEGKPVLNWKQKFITWDKNARKRSGGDGQEVDPYADVI